MKIKKESLYKFPKRLVGIMKKSSLKEFNKKCKNPPYNGLNRNIVSPELSEIWVSEPRPTGAEITEIKSSNSEEDRSSEEQPNNLAHPWSYVNQNRFANATRGAEQNHNTYNQTNTTPTERRFCEKTAYFNLSTEAKSIYNDIMAAGFLNERFHYNNVTSQRDPTSYTHTNEADSESSESENYEEMVADYIKEAHKCNGYDVQTEDGWMYFRGAYVPEMFTFDIAAENNNTMNIHEVIEKNTQTSRAATPMPRLVVPKLDLAQVHTFPTLTEVTEPKNVVTSLPPVQGQNRSPKVGKSVATNTSTPNINWLGLSPRDQIRTNLRSYFEKIKRRNVSPLQDLNETPRSSFGNPSVHQNCNEVTPDKTEIFVVEPHNSFNDYDEQLNNTLEPLESACKPLNKNELQEPQNCNKNPIIANDSNTTVEDVNRDVKPNIANAEPQTTIYAEVNDPNNVTYVVYKYRENLTIEQLNLYKVPADEVYLMHDKSTQVSAANLTRHLGLIDFLRLFVRPSPKPDYVERRSWVRRVAACFCCK